MATLPYRFECDLVIDEAKGAEPKTNDPDPTVRVYLGETYTNDNTGEHTLNRQQMQVVGVKFSNLEQFLAASIKGVPPDLMPAKQSNPPSIPVINFDRVDVGQDTDEDGPAPTTKRGSRR